MDFELHYTGEQEEFRQEVQEWLKANLPDDMEPLVDPTNPSPEQGWRQGERAGLDGRRNADAMLALAFVHHLAIGRNIPLPEVVAWLTGLAPRGVIEFVPKSDLMVQGMLMLREDIFDDYTLDAFLASLSQHAKITRQTDVSQTGRSLIWYDR